MKGQLRFKKFCIVKICVLESRKYSIHYGANICHQHFHVCFKVLATCLLRVFVEGTNCSLSKQSVGWNIPLLTDRLSLREPCNCPRSAKGAISWFRFWHLGQQFIEGVVKMFCPMSRTWNFRTWELEKRVPFHDTFASNFLTEFFLYCW